MAAHFSTTPHWDDETGAYAPLAVYFPELLESSPAAAEPTEAPVLAELPAPAEAPSVSEIPMVASVSEAPKAANVSEAPSTPKEASVPIAPEMPSAPKATGLSEVPDPSVEPAVQPEAQDPSATLTLDREELAPSSPIETEAKPEPASPAQPKLAAVTAAITSLTSLFGRGAIAACVALVCLFGAYLVGVAHFSSHFPPRSTVLGVEAGWKSTDELIDELEDTAQDYELSIEGGDFHATLAANELGLSVDGKRAADSALEQVDPWGWIFGILVKREYAPTEGVSIDETRLAETLTPLVEAFNTTAVPPTDAFATYETSSGEESDSTKPASAPQGAEDHHLTLAVASDEAETESGTEESADGPFTIVPEVLGTKLDPAAVCETASEAALDLTESAMLDESELARPTYESDSPELIAACELANRMSALDIPLVFEGKELIRVGGEQIRSWLDFDKTADGSIAVHVNEGRCWRWCFDTLNPIVNGESEVRVWEVSSPETAKALMPRIEALDESPIEIPTITIETRPPETEGHEARGRHIDVNLSTQYARFYDTDGKTVIWRSGIVSGNPYTGHATPQGEYEIVELEQDTILYGPEDPETHEPEYASPVRWWMSFNYSDGFHDADWRWDWEFGTDMYLWDGSHGCINLPIDKAGELWEIIELGDAVYIHE